MAALVSGRWVDTTFYQWSLPDWEKRIGQPLVLSSAAPDMIELQMLPRMSGQTADLFDLENGIALHDLNLERVALNEAILTVTWRAVSDDLSDYSIAVHVVGQDPPTGPDDLIVQADRNHPVYGWYPTSRWQPNELVTDHFRLQWPLDEVPVAIRLSMYRAVNGQFENSAGYSEPLKIGGAVSE